MWTDGIRCQTRARSEDALWNHGCCIFSEPALVWFIGPSKVDKAPSQVTT